MKTKFNCSLISILCITLFSFATGFAQEKTKKQIKEEQKLEKQKQKREGVAESMGQQFTFQCYSFPTITAALNSDSKFQFMRA